MVPRRCWLAAHLVCAHDELLCHLASHAHINPGQQLLLARAELIAQRHLHTHRECAGSTVLHRDLGLTSAAGAAILSQEAEVCAGTVSLAGRVPMRCKTGTVPYQYGGGADSSAAGTALLREKHRQAMPSMCPLWAPVMHCVRQKPTQPGSPWRPCQEHGPAARLWLCECHLPPPC